MDDCTDMLTSQSDDRSKVLNIPSSSISNIMYLNGHKNPFDTQFELALKNKIYSTSTSTTTSGFFANRSSPLNTPLIQPDSAFTGAIPITDTNNANDANSAIITTAQITNLIIETESSLSKEDANENCGSKADNLQENGTDGQTQAAIPIETCSNEIICNNNKDKEENTTKMKFRSNMVSVICPPLISPLIKSNEQKIRSAPVILRRNSNNTHGNIQNHHQQKITNNNNNLKIDDIGSQGIENPKKNVELSTNISPVAPNPMNLAISKDDDCILLSPSQPSICFNNFHIDSQTPTTDFMTDNNFPKRNLTTSSLTTTTNITDNSSLSSLAPVRRKGKSVDELMNKIKETEAALPPRAKPGRKSKLAMQEDSHEKKRLSLERNRAAAMRCRLKKKKEIDELKRKVETYEKQNQNLQQIIRSLYNQVDYLKNELLRHKDCK